MMDQLQGRDVGVVESPDESATSLKTLTNLQQGLKVVERKHFNPSKLTDPEAIGFSELVRMVDANIWYRQHARIADPNIWTIEDCVGDCREVATHFGIVETLNEALAWPDKTKN
jgi:hypothetical protein